MTNNAQLMIILEGFKDKVYFDSEDNKTIGIGFNMDMIGANTIWNQILTKRDFIEVYNGREKINLKEATLLFNFFWNKSTQQVEDRIDKLNLNKNKEILNFQDMPEYKKFILVDIAYNTGSVKQWTKVFYATKYRRVLLEARRKQRYLDSRIAKIGRFFNLIHSIEEAKAMGLSQTQYIE